jgi:hypothetical protein
MLPCFQNGTIDTDPAAFRMHIQHPVREVKHDLLEHDLIFVCCGSGLQAIKALV